jgi:hypothetical protein
MRFTHVLCKMSTILSLKLLKQYLSSTSRNTRDRSLCHILYESVKEYTRVSLAFLIKKKAEDPGDGSWCSLEDL